MFSYSFGLLKPDCYQRGLGKRVMRMISDYGLRLVVSRMLRLSEADVRIIYSDCQNDSYFDDHARFMQSGPVTAFVVSGDYAIQRLNDLVGYTIPAQSGSRTIRLLGSDICRNLVHSSSDFPSFVREAKVVFGQREFDYLYRQEFYL